MALGCGVLDPSEKKNGGGGTRPGEDDQGGVHVGTRRTKMSRGETRKNGDEKKYGRRWGGVWVKRRGPKKEFFNQLRASLREAALKGRGPKKRMSEWRREMIVAAGICRAKQKGGDAWGGKEGVQKGKGPSGKK